MSGSAAVLLAIGPAVVTGLVGYRGALLQAAVSIKGVEAENNRLREQLREDERRRRFAGYHDFLTLIYRLDSMMVGFAPLSRESFEDWLDRFQRLYGGIELSASEPVRNQVGEVKNAIDQIGIEAERARGEGFERKFAGVYAHRRAQLESAVEAAIREMRAEAGQQWGGAST